MFITMDRYGADWSMVDRGWQTHVLGKGRQFASAHEAIETWRKEIPGIIDQDLKEFVIAEGGKPVGTIEDGDSVIYFNFRGDRALEMTSAFETGKDFDKFDRVRVPAVEYAGMMEYDGDLHIPAQVPRHPAGDRPHDGRIPRGNRSPLARDQRNAKIRTRHLLPSTETNSASSTKNSRPSSRSRATCSPSSSAPG